MVDERDTPGGGGVNGRSSIQIYGWMLNELGLGLSETVVYATIYSFTNGTSDHCFRGSAGYLAEWCRMSRRGVMKVLKSLEDKGLIQRRERVENGVKFIDYYTDYGDATKFTGYEHSSQGTCEHSSHHNSRDIDIHKAIHKEDISSPLKKFAAEAATIDPLPGPLPEEMREFIEDSYRNYPSVRYQMDKRGSNFIESNLRDLDKLNEEYGEETVKTVLRFVKQDPFRCKQIQTVGKLRKKNKDGVPYMVVMMEKIKEYKPKVLDLDAIN